MENCDWSAAVLAAINLVNLGISTWNHRKLQKVRSEQKEVAADLRANGRHGTNGNGDRGGKSK